MKRIVNKQAVVYQMYLQVAKMIWGGAKKNHNPRSEEEEELSLNLVLSDTRFCRFSFRECNVSSKGSTQMERKAKSV